MVRGLERVSSRVGTATAPQEVGRGHRSAPARLRPTVRGKFLYAGDRKLYLRGVTYGTFHPEPESDAGDGYHDPATVEQDFSLMAANGINAVRTYTVPPCWLLDCAERHGLYVMVGLPWEQHVAFLDDSARAADIVRRVRAGVRACAGHPALLAFAVGNEIPASIVRWHGARRIEGFLERLYEAVKDEDPGALVTYVNFPTTEYLELPFVDFVTFNVYLETQERLEAYLARLQNLAGERPLLMAEIGLDSRRNGEETQARVLDWQVSTAFASGCAGAFLFAWTDEWYRGGFEIEDWDFGLTRRDRSAKPALSAVRAAFAAVPFVTLSWPRVSIVVCTYNGARTLADTLEGLTRLAYPDYEVIVVDDGSSDASSAIAGEYDVRLIRTENRGLSSARNTGLWAATGEIVAYIDDDAYPDPHWLQYLAAAFRHSDHVGIGGPNIAPDDDGLIAEAVASAPGSPTHVLLSDRVAEHIPGCNMAFLRRRLIEIGGFDPQFEAAGDDVDICWRLQERGWTIGFSPAAVVWHHRRNSIRTYWKQQQGYGRAEALLEAKWPAKYNALGHLAWSGRIYGKGVIAALAARRGRIYGGTWGAALFQSVYQPAPGLVASLPLMPEWYLLTLGLGGLGLLGLSWHPLLVAWPLFVLALLAPVAQAVQSARRAWTLRPNDRPRELAFVALTTLLYVLQPLARLRGRFRHGLTPWRRGVPTCKSLALPRRRTLTRWDEEWHAPEERLARLEETLIERGVVVRRGGDFDRWDLQLRGGLLGSARLRLAIEEHGAGRQLVRLRLWPVVSWPTIVCAVAGFTLAGLALAFGGVVAAATLAALSLALAGGSLFDAAAASGAGRLAFAAQGSADAAAAFVSETSD